MSKFAETFQLTVSFFCGCSQMVFVSHLTWVVYFLGVNQQLRFLMIIGIVFTVGHDS